MAFRVHGANLNCAPEGAEACVIAFDTALVLAHIEIDEKSTEIPAVQRLSAEEDLAGCLVTCDAMQAQKNRHDRSGPPRRERGTALLTQAAIAPRLD